MENNTGRLISAIIAILFLGAFLTLFRDTDMVGNCVSWISSIVSGSRIPL